MGITVRVLPLSAWHDMGTSLPVTIYRRVHATNVTTNLDSGCLSEINTTFPGTTNETQYHFNLEEGQAEVQSSCLPNRHALHRDVGPTVPYAIQGTLCFGTERN
jgi:hypothetical protein